MFNSCRESGDHGPFKFVILLPADSAATAPSSHPPHAPSPSRNSSWDRQVFTTYKNVNGDKVIKDNDTITQNFMISNYQGQEAIDNDDGSAYYNTHSNFLVCMYPR